MYIRDYKNEQAEQNSNFDHIIQEKLNAAAQTSVYVQSQKRQYISNQPVQPFHSQNLVLKELPCAHDRNLTFIKQATNQKFLMFQPEINATVMMASIFCRKGRGRPALYRE